MAINPALLAHSLQSTQPTAQGILGGVEALKNLQNRNKLLNLTTQEYQANAPVRQMERQNSLSALEQDGILVLAHAMKNQAQTGADMAAWANSMADRYAGTGLEPMLREAAGMFQQGQGEQALQAADQVIANLTPQDAEAYTLAPGAKRFQGNQMIAENPAQQDQWTTLSAEESAALGAPPGVRLQRSADGKLAAVGGGGQTINVNSEKAPSGYRWTTDKNGNPMLETIPGGPAWKEEQAAKQKDVSRTAGVQRAGGTVIQDLGRAIELLPEMIQGDGVVGANARAASAKVPGTTEYYINEFMDSAKSNIGLDKLQQMRESSPTGGALGQVPIAQQLRLEKVLGQADVTMTPEMMADNMHRIQNIYFDIMYGSKAERQVAIEQGKMTQEESDKIDRQYYDLSFDEFGKRKTTESPYERWKRERGIK